MPYSIRLPDGRVVGNIPDDVDPYDAKQQIEKAFPDLAKMGQPEEESGFFRQALDVPTQVGKGVFTGVRMLTDVFGADNPVSQSIRGVEDYMDSLLSAQAKNDQQEIARIMQEAEDKGVADKVIAGARAFAAAPVDLMSQALGTAVPTVAAGLAGSLAKLGALGVRAVQAGVGAATGAGVVKGSIYDAVKDALVSSGESPEVAEAKASEAQSYGGENWGSILAGTALGAVAGSTGIEKMLVDRLAAKKSAEEVAKGIARRAVEGGLKEFTPEFVQAAQEQVAANLALQKFDFDVDTFRGAIEQGTLEGLAGFGLGAGLGAVGGRRAPEPEAPPEVPEVPKTVSSNTYNVIGLDGNPTTVTVTQDELGDIVARDEFGEEADLTNIVSRGISIEDAVKQTFSFEEAPEPIPAAEVAPVAPSAAEVAPITPPAAPVAAPVEAPPVAPVEFIQPAPEPVAAPTPVAEAVAAAAEPPVGRVLKDGSEITVETESSPEAFSKLVQMEFGQPKTLVAKDKNGQEVGRLSYMEGGGPIDVFVNEEYRRLGIASALYDELEKRGGKIPAEDSGVAISEEARALRASRAATKATLPTEELEAEEVPETKGFVLQNRDRSTPASINQMNAIAASPDYGMVGFSRDFAVGAPVVSGAGVPKNLLGKKDYATTSDGRRIPVQYAVLPADKVITSNDINGAINPAYADQDVFPVKKVYRAIAGNGRATGIAESYRRGTAQRYKQELLADELHGVSPEAIQSIENPVLVRVMPWENLTADIGDVSNTTGVAGLSAVDQAKTDVNRVDFGTLEFYENGEPTARAVKTFIQAMPMAEQANLIDINGEPTAQAIDRFNAALFAKAYADEDLIRMFAQAKDPEARLVISALAQLSPDMARLDGLGALDVRQIFIDAAKIIISGKRKNLSLAKIAQQTDMTVDPAARLVVELFAKNPRSNREAIEAIRNVTDFAYQEGTKEAEDIFGEVPKATREEVLGRLRREDEQAGAEVVEPAEGRGAAEEVTERAEAEPGAVEPPAAPEEGGPAEGTKFRSLAPEERPDFELKSETREETLARQEREAKERAEREAKEIADREREAFRLQQEQAPAVPPTQMRLFDIGSATPSTIVPSYTQSFTREFDRLTKVLNDGRITPEQYATRVQMARKDAILSKKQADIKARVRGLNFIIEKMRNAARRGLIPQESVELTEWFIKQNPDLVSDLGISIRKETERNVAGQYMPGPRIVQLVSGSTKRDTAVHEILHHLEKMMPEKVRNDIFKSWAKQYATAKKAAQKANNKNLIEYFKLLDEHHETGLEKPFEEALSLIKRGKVEYGNYQYANPSEFWAVNASRIVEGKYDVRGDRLAALKKWLSDLYQAMKDIFGLKSDAPILRALDSLSKSDGKYISESMLADAGRFMDITSMSTANRGQMALDIVKTLGRGVEPPKTDLERLKGVFVDDRGNMKITPETAKKQAVRFLDRVETWGFTSDAALNNAIRREIADTTMSQKEKIGALLSVSSSQAVHADGVASLFMRYGGINYNPETYKYEAVDRKDNLISLVRQIDNLAKTYNIDRPQAERVAHTAFEAKRLRSLQEANETLDGEISALRSSMAKASRSGDEKTRLAIAREIRRKVKDYKFIHMTKDEIDAGLRLIELMPKEMNDIINTWNGIRRSAAKELVQSGLWSEAEADSLLSNMDYVPFYREDQLEKGKGPKEFLRSLQVQAKEKKLKGSSLAVNDIFDNMARWTQYAVKRSVINRLALAKIDAAKDFGFAKKMEKSGPDTVRVWRDGEAEYYRLDDPMFMEAFAGLEPISIPTWKIAAKISSFLRQSVVLNPIFSVSQVSQDAIAAIYTSGLKPRYALTIPARAAKEFVKTLFGVSKTHKDLERIAAVGIRDFTSSIARTDAEVVAGLKAPPGVWGKVKNFLEHISMASDNAVRQAVYEASIAQGVSRAEALEKAFQLINFRNRGSSKAIALAGQVIPFFNAYMAAQHVALKVVSGVGISPSERKEALKTLIYTTAAVQALALVYAMMMDDDEEYKATPSIIRDRLLMIPGIKMSIPIRPDIFSIPKILTEHTYMLMTDQGSADGRKFRDSLKAALGNAILGPTPVPQAIKPLAEVGINYNFFQGRPLVGTYQKGLETERQFNDSTSEFAKWLGSSGMVSPIAADHLIRGMFGSVGGLGLLITNQLIHNDPDVPRPEMSVRDALASLPGTTGFVRREYETGIKNDFYVLRDEVSKVVNTLNDLKARSPHEIEEFLAKEKNVNRLGMQKAVNKITDNLSKIRREISRISQAENMSAREKQEAIKYLREIEQEMLSGVNVKELRRMADL